MVSERVSVPQAQLKVGAREVGRWFAGSLVPDLKCEGGATVVR